MSGRQPVGGRAAAGPATGRRPGRCRKPATGRMEIRLNVDAAVVVSERGVQIPGSAGNDRSEPGIQRNCAMSPPVAAPGCHGRTAEDRIASALVPDKPGRGPRAVSSGLDHSSNVSATLRSAGWVRRSLCIEAPLGWLYDWRPQETLASIRRWRSFSPATAQTQLFIRRLPAVAVSRSVPTVAFSSSSFAPADPTSARYARTTTVGRGRQDPWSGGSWGLPWGGTMASMAVVIRPGIATLPRSCSTTDHWLPSRSATAAPAGPGHAPTVRICRRVPTEDVVDGSSGPVAFGEGVADVPPFAQGRQQRGVPMLLVEHGPWFHPRRRRSPGRGTGSVEAEAVLPGWR